MSEKQLRAARVVAVVASTVISIACGTNYAYSAWAPSFAERMILSATESNWIGTFGNLGMYCCGIPLGVLVDNRGARPGTILGALLLGIGYFALQRAYVGGPGSMALPLMCIFSFLTGAGGAAAFLGAIKTAAVNWPQHRGTATAFPLAGFGLSAFFFSTVATFALPNNTPGFLLLLSIATFSMILVSSLFLRVVPQSPAYSALSSTSRAHGAGTSLLRTKSKDSDFSKDDEPGMDNEPGRGSSSSSILRENQNRSTPEITKSDSNDSLLHHEEADDELSKSNSQAHDSLFLDVRGLAMVKTTEFYELFFLMGLLTGVGLMTINNVGNDAQALWAYADSSMPIEEIRHRQMMHVAILSVGSFLGRLSSGIGSDLIVKKLHMSRFWCLFISSATFLFAQAVGITLENPHLLIVLSGSTGLAYGFLFGVGPTLVADTFGVNGLSQNWGFMILGPAGFGNLFNMIYGKIYDHHSNILPSGHRECLDGRFCYKDAYWVTFFASVVSMILSLWCIKHRQMSQAWTPRMEDDDSEDYMA